MIYLNNSATSFPKPPIFADAWQRASVKVPGHGTRSTYREAKEPISCRQQLAKLLHIDDSRRIIYAQNATHALNIGLLGFPWEKGDVVLTSRAEHNSVLRPLYRLETMGTELSFLSCGERGELHCEGLEAALRPDTGAVVCTHASNLTGNSVDLKRIGNFCREHNLLFIVDASQTAGTLEIDMQAMNIDVLCFTGHKGLYGPQGTGGICVREGLHISPLKSGGSGIQTYNKEQPSQMPAALEAGTLNGHGIAGLHAALSFIEEVGVEAIHGREMKLMRKFHDGVKEIPGVRIYGDFSDDNRAPIVALNIRDYDSAQVSDELAVGYGISTRPGAHCAPLMHQSLGTVEQGIVRFSFSWFNTEDEIETGIRAVGELAGV